jgi:peptidoglycan/LPS O-acetylase OafA/YrhL
VLLHHTRGAPFFRLHGYRGVWVFFVLSGFLITTLALRQESQLGRLDLRAFAVRRIFRIMPLYYLALGANLIGVLAFGLEPYPERLTEHLVAFGLYSSEFSILRSGFHIPFGQSWSLGIEEKFYLAWPVLAFWLLSNSRRRIPITLAFLGLTATLTVTSAGLAQMWGSYTDILIGCLVAFLLRQRRSYDKLVVLGRPPVAWALVIGLALATVNPGTGTQIGECLYSLLAAAVLVGLVTSTSGLERLLVAPWLMRLGAWSYAIYLTHTLCIDLVSRLIPPGHLGDLMTLPAALALDVPLCWLLHVYVEQRLIQWGRQLSTRIQADRTTGETAPVPVGQA